MRNCYKEAIRIDDVIQDVVVHDPGGLGLERQVIACSPNVLNISCPEDHSIEIINGNYGRFTITLCNGKVSHTLLYHFQ